MVHTSYGAETGEVPILREFEISRVTSEILVDGVLDEPAAIRAHLMDRDAMSFVQDDHVRPGLNLEPAPALTALRTDERVVEPACLL